MNEEYLRNIAAHFHALLVMQGAHDLFGKSLFQLTPDQDQECQNRAYLWNGALLLRWDVARGDSETCDLRTAPKDSVNGFPVTGPLLLFGI
jgi:hypothetical protein